MSSSETISPESPKPNRGFSLGLSVLMLVLVVLALVFGSDLFGKKEVEKPDPKPGPPPIELSFRKSQVPFKGLVAGIRNASKEEELSNFVIHVSSPEEKGERSHRREMVLKPQDTMTVGWVELDGWKLKEGDVMKVTCEQYEGEISVTVTSL